MNVRNKYEQKTGKRSKLANIRTVINKYLEKMEVCCSGVLRACLWVQMR